MYLILSTILMTQEPLKQLRTRIRQFAIDRDWLQFHNPKNLAMALTVEAGELMEIYQWLNTEQSAVLHHDPVKRKEIEGEIADIFVYLIHLVNVLDLDLPKIVNQKMDINDVRFPSNGSSINSKT